MVSHTLSGRYSTTFESDFLYKLVSADFAVSSREYPQVRFSFSPESSHIASIIFGVSRISVLESGMGLVLG